jgi:hypothetical protein
MTALRLAISAKHFGARFEYHHGQIVALGLDLLPRRLRREVDARLDDILAVVAEHSTPCDVRPSDVVDAARKIVTLGKPVNAT